MWFMCFFMLSQNFSEMFWFLIFFAGGHLGVPPHRHDSNGGVCVCVGGVCGGEVGSSLVLLLLSLCLVFAVGVCLFLSLLAFWWLLLLLLLLLMTFVLAALCCV